MKIRAAVAREKGAPLNLEINDLEAPRPDEILDMVQATGVCTTPTVLHCGMLPTPPPALPVASLLLTVVPFSVTLALRLKIPPPLPNPAVVVVLPVTMQFVSVTVAFAATKMPPPALVVVLPFWIVRRIASREMTL